MKQHNTAGGVLFDTTCKKVFLIHKLGRDEWLLPKGHIEDGESIVFAAKREIYEETGYSDFIILGHTPVMTNVFKFDDEGKEAVKNVHIFAVILLSDKNTDTKWQVEEDLGGSWFLVEDAIQKASYDDIREAIEKAHEKVKNCGHF